MTTENIQALFAPTYRRSKTIPSRIILAPINTGFARCHRPSSDLLRFHRDRSDPTIGISMVGNVAVTRAAAPYSGTPVLETSSDAGRFGVIARAVHRGGSLAGIQIAFSPPGLNPPAKWRPSDTEAERGRLERLVSVLDARFLEESLEHFINTTALAVKSGFDVVQIHASHGYLLSLLLSSAVNRRRDRFTYQGPWLDDFIQSLRGRCGNMLLSFRISVESGLLPRSRDLTETFELFSRLERNEVDLIDLSSGFYTVDRHLIYPSLRAGPIPLYDLARDFALRTTCLVTFAGNILDLRSLPDDMPDNLFCSIGRSFIADPGFSKKTSEGHFDKIVACQRTGHCHYYTRGRTQIECGVNRALSWRSCEP